MKDWSGKLIYLILLLALLTNLYVKWNKALDYDREVAYLVSSNIQVVFTVIESLERDLVVDDRYLSMSQAEMLNTISDATDYMFYTNRSLGAIYDLNNNFSVELFDFEWFLMTQRDRLNEGERIGQAEIDLIKELKELRRVYSNSGILSYYKYNHGPLEKMQMPEKTEKLFLEIQRAVIAYNKKQNTIDN